MPKQRLAAAKVHRRLGAVVVEMAVTLPVFLLILLGIIEFGRAMMVQQLLTHSARLGARRAILDGNTNAEVQQLIDDFCQDNITAGVTVAISINGQADAQLTGAQQGDLCEIGVSVPFSQVSLLPVPNWLGNSTLRGTCTMEHE